MKGRLKIKKRGEGGERILAQRLFLSPVMRIIPGLPGMGKLLAGTGESKGGNHVE